CKPTTDVTSTSAKRSDPSVNRLARSYSARFPKLLFGYLVQERPAIKVTLHVLDVELPHARPELGAQLRSGNVRRDDDVRQLPQRMLRRQWVGVMDIERCPGDRAGTQCLDQGRFLNDRAAGHVEQPRRLLQR